MCVAPRPTLRAIVASSERPSWTPILVLAALHFALGSVERDADGSVLMAVTLRATAWSLFDLTFAIAAGPLITAYVCGWFGGKASTSDLREAAVWTLVPISASAFFWIPTLLMPPPPTDALTDPMALIALPLFLCILIGLLWSVKLSVVMLAELERFPMWKAVVAGLLAASPAFVIMAVR